MSGNKMPSLDDFVSASRQTEHLPELIKFLCKWVVEDEPDSFRGSLGTLIGTYGQARGTIAELSKLLDRLYRQGTPPIRFGGFEAHNAHLLCLKLATQFLQDMLRICDPVRNAQAFGPNAEAYGAEFSRQAELVREHWNAIKAAMVHYTDFRDDGDRDLKCQVVRERTEIDRQCSGSSIVGCEISAVLDSPQWAEKSNSSLPDPSAAAVPGWVGGIVPRDRSALAEYLRERLSWVRDFPKNNAAYMRERADSPGGRVILREPDPRYVKARIQIAQDAIDNAHRWLDDYRIAGKPAWPAPLQDWRTGERTLSELLRFVEENAITKKAKRSTKRGDGQLKLSSALTKHHGYAKGGCGNFAPINSNELAKSAIVSTSTANSFFNKWFGSSKKAKDGYSNYRFACNDNGKLIAILKAINGELTPPGEVLFGRKVPDQAESSDHRGDRRRKPLGSELRHEDEG